MQTEPQASQDFRDYIRPVWDRKWLILAIVAVATALTYVYTSSRPKDYEATTKVLITANGAETLAFGSGANPVDDRTVANQALLLGSRQVATAVAKRIHYRGPATDLLGRVTTAATSGADFITVTAHGTTPSDAAGLANAFTQTYVDLRRSQVDGQVQAALSLVQGRLAALGDRTARAGARDLQTRLRQLKRARTIRVSDAQQVDPAFPPRLAVAPRPKRSAAFAFALSLMLALGLAYALDRFDWRLRKVEDVEAAYGLPVLTTLPRFRDAPSNRMTAERLSPVELEGFRFLRVNLEFIRLDEPSRLLLVTSALPEEGKTMVVRNLARAFAEADHRVAVIDCDLRRGSLSATFGLGPGPGLTDVLRGAVTVAEAMRPVALSGPGREAARTNGGGTATLVESPLQVLGAGQAIVNPTAVLSSQRMRDVLAEVSANFDVVLLDTAPVLAVSDALPLMQSVDGIVTVARMGRSTREIARRTRETLTRAAPGGLLGIVVNDVEEGTLGGGGAYGLEYPSVTASPEHTAT